MNYTALEEKNALYDSTSPGGSLAAKDAASVLWSWATVDPQRVSEPGASTCNPDQKPRCPARPAQCGQAEQPGTAEPRAAPAGTRSQPGQENCGEQDPGNPAQEQTVGAGSDAAGWGARPLLYTELGELQS